MMQVAIGHEGKTALKVICTGQAAHSALAPHAVNAIHLASDLVQRLRESQATLETSGAREAGYDIAYSTILVGTIRGGTALNVVPDLCELEVEIRNITRDDPARLVDQIRGFATEIERDARRPDQSVGISIELTNEYPGPDTSDRSSAVTFVNLDERPPEYARRIRQRSGTVQRPRNSDRAVWSWLHHSGTSGG